MDALTPNQIVGRNVRRYRKLKGIHQSDLAEKMTRRTGRPWTASTVSHLEKPGPKRERQTTVAELVALSRSLGVSALELLLPEEGDEVVLEPNIRMSRGEFGALIFHLPDDLLPAWRLDRARKTVLAGYVDLVADELEAAGLPADVQHVLTVWLQLGDPYFESGEGEPGWKVVIAYDDPEQPPPEFDRLVPIVRSVRKRIHPEVVVGLSRKRIWTLIKRRLEERTRSDGEH